MSDFKSIVLRIAYEDDKNGTNLDEDFDVAKKKVERSAGRKQLSNGLALTAVNTCETYDAHERILTIIITALMWETKKSDRDHSMLQTLADMACTCINHPDDKGEQMKLLVEAKNQFKSVKSDTVSKAFASVSAENQKTGKVISIATQRKSAKPSSAAAASGAAAASLAAVERDVIAKKSGRSPSGAAASRPGVQSVRGDEASALDERIARKSAQQQTGRSRTSASARSGSRASGTARSALNDLESEVLAKSSSRTSNNNNRRRQQQQQEEEQDGKMPTFADVPPIGKESSTADDQQLGDSDLDDGAQQGRRGRRQSHRQQSHRGREVQHAAAAGLDAQPDVVHDVWDDERANNEVEYGNDTGLAVAVAVEESDPNDPNNAEDENFIPQALEYDPDSKPPIYQNRRFRLYAILAVVLLVVIVVSVVIGVTSSNKPSMATNEEPTPSPTSIDDQLIIDRITTLVGEKYLSQDWTPHSKALNWLLFDDSASLGPSSANLIQRYVLALFYFATTESKKWLSCNPTFVEDDAENLSSSCTFKLLDDVYPQLTYVDVEYYRWLSDRSECNWSGIFCDPNGDVRGIELFGQEIQSTLPKELALLPQLQSIGLQWNSFYGALPAEFASMRHLVTLDLHYNMFSGEIPREWFISSDSSTNWPIQSLNLAGNELSGNLPPTISNLKLLKGLMLYQNQLTGSLPSEIGEMDHLAYIRLTRNNMVGSIPSEIGKLTGLSELWLNRNSLSGSIPSEIGNMSSLNDLRLNYNRLNGELPEELYNLENLYRLDLYNCKFSGSISSAIGNLKHLESLRIRSNDFTGSLPSEIGLLTHVDEIWMNNNDMTGSIPQEVCELRSNIGLIVLDADCPDKIDCDDDCCTGCCLDNGLSICESERT